MNLLMEIIIMALLVVLVIETRLVRRMVQKMERHARVVYSSEYSGMTGLGQSPLSDKLKEKDGTKKA